MTTGIKESNHMSWVSTDCGMGQVGHMFSRTWNGDNDPKIHKKANAYVMEYQETRDGIIMWSSPPGGVKHTGTWRSCFGGPVFLDPGWDANNDLQLVNQLGDIIRGHEFNAAVSLGAEGKEALEQIAGAAMSMYRGMRDLKRGNVQGALRHFGLNPKMEAKVGLHKSLSQKVLATQLGWLPLMADVDDAYDAVRALTGKPISKTYMAKGHTKAPAYPNGDVGGQVMGESLYSKKLHWTLSEDFTVWESLSLSDPWDIADMAWNATMLSFIADWFIPVGSYLSARSVLNKVRGSGYYTVYQRSRASGVPNFGTYSVENAPVYFYKWVRVTRVPISSLSGLVALPRFKDFKSIPSWKRALTAVTLATQMFL